MFIMKKLNILILAMLMVFTRLSFASEKIYTFGVVPQQAASEMAETWLPFLAWVSAKSGVTLRFVTAPDIPAFEARLAKGEYDLAYMNPYHYTVFHKKSGYEALAKEKKCGTCHAVDKTKVGPSYKNIAAKYAGQAGAADKLAGVIAKGGSGSFGSTPMPPTAGISDADAKKLAAWILATK